MVGADRVGKKKKKRRRRERGKKKEGRDGFQDKMAELAVGDVKREDEGAFTADRPGRVELVKREEEEEVKKA